MSETSSTVERCVQLLDVVSELGSATAQQLAGRLEISRTSVQRLITTLERRGFLSRTPAGFVLATYLRVISDVALRGLRSAAHNVAREIAEDCHDTVVTYVADADDVVVLDEAITTLEQPARARHPVGTRVGMAAGAGGLAFLAHARPATQARLTAAAPGLAAVLAEVRAAGHALARDRPRPQVAEIAVPVLGESGRAIASLALLAPAWRAAALPGHLPRLREGAARIAAGRRTDDEDRRP